MYFHVNQLDFKSHYHYYIYYKILKCNTSCQFLRLNDDIQQRSSVHDVGGQFDIR